MATPAKAPKASAPAAKADGAPKLKAVEPKSAGQSAADELALRVRAERRGVSPEQLVIEEDASEDWMEDVAASRPPAPAALAGVYRVTHGALWFGPEKVVRTGRKVRLNAEDARMFIEQELVVRIGD